MSRAKTRVVVAMSGGLDSSVAAALLVEAGCDVVGMMMRLWSDPAMGGAAHNQCCTPRQMDDARRVADKLGIPFYALDTQEVFRRRVVQYFIEQHRQGLTPNPCLECNRHIRFDWLLNNALALDADYLATGHYARIDRDLDGRFRLRAGRDASKDQSYALSVLGQRQLRHALFPVGEYAKSEVRRLALKFGLNLESKKESQDLCFLGKEDYRRFLNVHAPDVMKPGPIMRQNGELLGEHGGLSNYTIGQRKGLGISYREPLYVLALDHVRNALVVGPAAALGRDTLLAERVNWISGSAPEAAFRAQVKIRYKSRPQPAFVEPRPGRQFQVKFDAPQRGITPGQAAVIYQGDVCLGGGSIVRSEEFLAAPQ